jgi:hypothetical protein
MSEANPLVAVFDIGKTNAKIALLDPALGQEIWSARRPNQIVEGPGGRELDVVAIEQWLFVHCARRHSARVTPSCRPHGAARSRYRHEGACWRRGLRGRVLPEVANDTACAIMLADYRPICRTA